MSVVPSALAPVLRVVPLPPLSVDSLIGNDYETGAWTPDPFATVSLVGNFNGWYTKIGNQVTVAAYLDFNTKVGTSGNVSIRGLPYPARATVPTFQNVPLIHASFVMPVAGTTLGARIAAGSDSMLLISYSADATSVSFGTVDVSAVQAASFMYINCTYITDDDA